MNCYDIPAYTYKADFVCHHCMEKQAYEDVKLTVSQAWADNYLVDGNIIDIYWNINGYSGVDESEWDSDEFPKVVFRDQLDEEDCCGSCGCNLKSLDFNYPAAA